MYRPDTLDFQGRERYRHAMKFKVFSVILAGVQVPAGCNKWWLIPVAGVGVFVCLPLVAQQGAAAWNTPQYTLKTSVNRVLVDVVVTGAHGNPVHGLTKSDFVVAEDGVPQKVLAFDVHNFDEMTYVPPKLPALGPDAFVNLPPTPERGPLYSGLLRSGKYSAGISGGGACTTGEVHREQTGGGAIRHFC